MLLKPFVIEKVLKEKTKKLEKRGESEECKLQEAGGLDPLSLAPCPCMQFVKAEFLATFDILRKESCHQKKNAVPCEINLCLIQPAAPGKTNFPLVYD